MHTIGTEIKTEPLIQKSILPIYSRVNVLVQVPKRFIENTELHSLEVIWFVASWIQTPRITLPKIIRAEYFFLFIRKLHRICLNQLIWRHLNTLPSNTTFSSSFLSYKCFVQLKSISHSNLPASWIFQSSIIRKLVYNIFVDCFQASTFSYALLKIEK